MGITLERARHRLAFGFSISAVAFEIEINFSGEFLGVNSADGSKRGGDDFFVHAETAEDDIPVIAFLAFFLAGVNGGNATSAVGDVSTAVHASSGFFVIEWDRQIVASVALCTAAEINAGSGCAVGVARNAFFAKITVKSSFASLRLGFAASTASSS